MTAPKFVWWHDDRMGHSPRRDLTTIHRSARRRKTFSQRLLAKQHPRATDIYLYLP